MENGYIKLALLFLSLLYFFFAILSFLLTIKLIRSKESLYNISYFFYSGLLFTTIFRTINLIIISFKNNDVQNSNFLFNILVLLPDVLFTCFFFILVWHALIHYIVSHINVANDTNLSLSTSDDDPKIKKKIYYVLYIIMPFYLIGFSILYIFNYYDIIKFNSFIMIFAIVNIASPFLILIINYFFFKIKFSGRPYKDEQSKKETQYIINIAIVFGVARVVSGGVELFLKFILKDINEIKKLNDDLWKIFLLFAYFCLTELLPIYFISGNDFYKTFIHKKNLILNGKPEEENSLMNNSNNSLRISNDKKNPEKNNEDISNNSNNNIIIQNNKNINDNKININNNNNNSNNKIKNFLIKIKEIEIKEELYSRKNGLGKLFTGKYNNDDVILRILNFDRLNRYEIEEIQKDVQNIINLKHQNIVNIIGVCLNKENSVIIVMPYYKKGSLFDFLHNENNKINLTLKQKINISIGIIKGIDYLHKNNIVHYHLTSKNILIDDNLNPLIADYGFNNLKKTYNIFNKYHNLNSYSSPEMLTETNGKLCGSLNNNFNEKNDIYSYGLILWEIFNETIPFNVKLKDVKNYVLNEKLRPEIKEENIDKELANLIRECWDTEPSNRPEIDKILNLLIKKYKEIEN